LRDKCQFESTLHLLGQKHVLSILRYLSDNKTAGFNELQKALAINRRTLTQRLRQLVREGLLDRRAFHQIPPRVEYSLTVKALELVRIFSTIRDWDAKYRVQATQPEEDYVLAQTKR